MLSQATAVRFDRLMGNGKTRPSLMACTSVDGAEVEMIVKFAAGCEARELSLVREAIGALLAADLDLPVPEPFIVSAETDFVHTIPDASARTQALSSPRLAFGSKKLPPGFSTYPAEKSLPRALLGLAAEIFAFDQLIANPDRTVANPNLLFNGRTFGIYDHELAFFTEGVIGWRPPWEAAGPRFPAGMPPHLRHVFQEELRGQTLDLNRLSGALEAISHQRIDDYREALPLEWMTDAAGVERIIGYIRELKEHLPMAINQLQGALA